MKYDVFGCTTLENRLIYVLHTFFQYSSLIEENLDTEFRYQFGGDMGWTNVQQNVVKSYVVSIVWCISR